MKIVFVGPFGLQPKGTMSARALPLAKALAQRGHAVTLLIPPWDDPDRAGQSWTDGGVEIINVSLPPRVPFLFHLLLTRALVARVLALQPDVVHCFKPKAYAGLTHLVLWWLRRIGGVSLRLVVDADDWEQAWNRVSPYTPAQKRLFTWQEPWGLRHADALTVASRALADMAAGYRPDAQQSIYYVPNGFPTGGPAAVEPNDSVARAEAGASVRAQWQVGDKPVVLLYSRFAEFRLERIVSLARRVAQQMPNAHWLIVGRGLQGQEQTLKQQLTQAGLGPERIHFAGWLPVEQLPGYFAAAHVAVFPYDDTLINRTKCSVKLIDLLAAGLPVVADAVGQNCEYIESGVSGLLTPPEDDVALAEGLVELLRQPDQRRRLGKAAAVRVRQNFSWSKLAQVAERAYR